MGSREGEECLPDQVALMCRLLHFPAVATPPATIATALVMGPSVGVAGRTAWVIGLSLLGALRFLAARAYLAAPRDVAATRRWLWLLLGLTAVIGAAWSLGGTVLLPEDAPIRSSLVSMCLIAALAAGFGALAPVHGGYAALALPFAVPMAAWQLAHGDWVNHLLAAIYLVFLLVLLGAAVRAANTTREQLRLVRANARLAESLRAERDALNRAIAELTIASEAKSRFLGHMSHALRTPLTVILGYSDLLLRDEPLGRRSESLERIRGAGNTLLGIVNDLLDAASMEGGRLALEESELSPAELLDEVVTVLRGLPDARELEIQGVVGAALPPRIRADRERLRQVLMNLGVNALRFTPAGRVALSLDRAGAEGDAPRLRVEVVDTGIGIPPEAQARLFRPFSQLDDPAARRIAGTGLGLAISRAIVERMGGTIGVDSRPGEGARFWFEVPFAPAGEPATDRYGARVPDAFQGAVLLAEDLPETREFLARFLRESGCAPVVEVGDGRALLAEARRRRYDVLLVDWRMPELDGLAAIAELRAAELAAGTPRTPAVVVTASALPEDRARCLAAGADAVVEKPVDLDRLAAVLRRWLKSGSATHSSAAATAAPRTVLVADDHAGNRQLLREMLEEEGFGRVEAVANGLEAVAAWEQGIYDVLLLDWQMPGLDGLGALGRIRALERELGRSRTAVVIVTGRLSDAERAACFAAGADECVAKPYTPDELLGAALRALAAVGR
ncbi:MAG: response regulator [Proteobacteria bacterium]|nr:response regulator [Pseudomonadota bacterium]